MRSVPSKTKAESDYPQLVFRRVMRTEDNAVNYSRERIEIEIIGLRSSAAKGDSLIEIIRTVIVKEFSAQTKTWGKYDAGGTPDPNGGLRLHCQYLSTTEGFSSELDEKAHVLLFLFAFVRA